MKRSDEDPSIGSRRSMLAESAALLVGGGIGSVATSLAGSASAQTTSPSEPAPLPWKWVRLDPLEAGRRAYRFYKEKGGCGTASYLSLLSLLM